MRAIKLVSMTLLALGAACANAAETSRPFVSSPVASFDEPWAMSFLPDGRLLVTEKRGRLLIATQAGAKSAAVTGTPEVAYGGQGGLGDVVLHPRYSDNGWIYLSYAEAGDDGKRGAAVLRARLLLDSGGGGQLKDSVVIWRQNPKVNGGGHYGHRLAFADNGDLYITSGERQQFEPAQDLQQNLGKVLRLRDDGSVPQGNPYAAQGGIAPQVWSYGHRNPLGIAFDGSGRLWVHEMGPSGGDELNLIERGANYGYPIVSNGNHYSGRDIPDHVTRPEFAAPKASWNPVISPAGFIIYSGDRFAKWKGSGFIGGLSSGALIRIAFDGSSARESERWDMGQRIREVEQGPDGAIWLLEDGKGGSGRLLKLTPA